MVEFSARQRRRRMIPWLPGTAMVLADPQWADGREVAASPRQTLCRQLERLAKRGMSANAATELEFTVFRDTYEQAWKGFHDLEPANLYNIDYSLLGTARVESLIRRIRNEMGGAGLTVENSKGECNLGQHEVNFRYESALARADNHAGEGRRDQRLRRRPGAVRELRRRPARLHARAHPPLRAPRQLLQALRRGLLRADRDRLGQGQPHLLAARGRPRRRAAGGEPAAGRRRQSLLALSALIAAGLHGIDNELALEPAFEGNAYASDKPRVPHNIYDAREAFAGSAVEIDAFGAAVTDWERYRGFERL